MPNSRYLVSSLALLAVLDEDLRPELDVAFQVTMDNDAR
jgi:hypothetical protein